MCRARFFNYSLTAPAEYRERLEHSLDTVDKSRAAVLYTPYVAAFFLSVVGALQSGINLSPLFGMLQCGIGAATVLTLGVSSIINQEATITSKHLITDGVKLGFFSTPPIPFDEEAHDENLTSEHEMHQNLAIDATKHRLLYS